MVGTRRWGPKISHFFPSPAPKAASHDSPRAQTCTLEGPSASKTPPKFHEKTPREREKERKWEREREKKREMLGLPLSRTWPEWNPPDFPGFPDSSGPQLPPDSPDSTWKRSSLGTCWEGFPEVPLPTRLRHEVQVSCRSGRTRLAVCRTVALVSRPGRTSLRCVEGVDGA